MNKIYLSLLILTGLIIVFNAETADAQIKIGTNGATIAPSSLLELESANQGLLLPRMADTVAINALTPPNGMLIYLTKAPAVGLYLRKAAGWEFISGSLGGANVSLVGEVVSGNNGVNNQVGTLGIYPRASFLGLFANVAAATQNNIGNTIVQRSASGDFSAGTITASLVGNANTATALQTPRLIYGNAFDGTANAIGIIDGSFGGTGINNNGKTITIAGGNLTTAGVGSLSLTTTAATAVTLPVTGTLYGTRLGSITSTNFMNSIAVSDRTGSGSVVFGTSPSLITPRATALVGNSITPAAGSTPSGVSDVVIAGTNLAGTVKFKSDGATPGGTPLITITYNNLTFPTGSYPILYPANASTAVLTGSSQVHATGTTTSFTIVAGTSPLPGPAEYSWNYHVIGN